MRILVLLVVLSASAYADSPETVVVTYSPRDGKEADVEKLIRKHWATLVRLKLVTSDPHLLYRDKDKDGLPVLVDVLTWKTHGTPDNAPAEVEAIWSQMEAACGKRGDRAGIEFHEVERLR